MSNERRAWSFVTGEQLDAYVQEARQLIALARTHRIHPFAAAVAGVALIRSAMETMGGEVGWWLDFVRTGKLPGLEVRMPLDPSQNPPKA